MKPNKLLVWLIALCMVLSLTPVSSFANETETDASDKQISEVETTDPAESTGQGEEIEDEAVGLEEQNEELEENSEEIIEENAEESEPPVLKAADAAAPTKMWIEPSETNHIPAQIDVFKSKTGGTNYNPTYIYQLYLPGDAVLDNCILSWDSDATLVVGDATYESGAKETADVVASSLNQEMTLSFKNGNTTLATWKFITYQGSNNTGVQRVFIEIEGGQDAIAAMDNDANHNTECTGVIYINGTQYELAKMKGRGNASWKESKDKKPYNINIGKKINFPGVDSEKTKKWSFLAEVLDHSLLCNRSGYNLAYQMGIGQDTTSADVWMNGEYQGCYTVTPKTDSFVTDDGYMIEQDNYKEDSVAQGGDPQFTLEGLKEASGWDSCYNRITVKKMGDNLLMKDGAVDESPDNMDSVAQDIIKPWLQEALNAIKADNGVNSKGKHYTDYIDIESFAQMYLMHEYVKSYDLCAGSILFHRDGMTENDKLYAGPLWDLDNAMGSVYQNSSLGKADDRTNGDRRSAQGSFIPLINLQTIYKTSIYAELGKHNDFMAEVYKQYNKHRSKFDSLASDTQQMMNDIEASAKMNHIKVTDLGTGTGKNNHYYSRQTTIGDGQYQQIYLATTNSKTDWGNYAANLKTYITTRSLWFHDTYYDPTYCDHTYEETITRDPTCTETGLATYTCTKCGDVLADQLVPALGHAFNDEDGICTRCDLAAPRAGITCSNGVSVTVYRNKDYTDIFAEDATFAISRNSDTGEVDSSGDGQINFKVNLAEGYELVSVTAEPDTSYKNLKPPAETNVENGYRLTKVKGNLSIAVKARCLHNYGDLIAKKEPTCTESGMNAYYQCSICNKYFDKDKNEITAEDLTIPALGHDLVHHDAKAATCTEKGWKAYDTCSRCNYTTYEEIDALGHDLEHHAAVAATCEKEGNIEYWLCKRDGCGKYFSDEDCTEEITAEETVIAKKAHTWNEGEITKQPTCTAKGVRTFTCTECGTERTEEIDALGHDPVHHDAKAATCTEKGWKAYDTCSRCDYTTYEEIDALGHDLEHHAAVAATCEREGNIEYWICKRDGCGKYFSDADCTEEITAEETVIAKKAHTWNEGEITKQPACTAKGVRTFTCTECGATRTEEIDALGHDLVHHDARAATCTVAGNSAYWTCNGCGKYFSDADGQTEIEENSWIIKPAHKWQTTYTVDKQATETTEGQKSIHCSICDEIQEGSVVVIPKLQPANQKAADGTAVGPGASYAVAEKAILTSSSDEGPAGTKYGLLKLKTKKQTKTSLTLNWSKVSKATKYVLYGNKCGKANKMKKLATVTGTARVISSVAGQKLTKGTYYKFIIVAIDKNNKVVSTSKTIHVGTKGGKAGNHKSVKIKKSVLSKAKKLKSGNSLKLKAKAVKASGPKAKKHRGISYESTNTKIATVSGKGVVKARAKGTCYIYAYAQDGVYKTVKVVVK